MVKIIIILFAVVFIIFAGVGYALYTAAKEPENNAAVFLCSKIDPSKRVVVFMGDSLTHGTVGFSYVDALAKDAELSNFIFINEGINSQLVYNLLNKVDKIVLTKPDYIFILIGTNDCRASLSDAEYQRFNKLWKLPARPTKERFANNLNDLIDKLRNQTSAGITLISIPPLGEKAESIPFQKSVEYSQAVKEISHQKKVDYIAFNEALTIELMKNSGTNVSGYELDVSGLYADIVFHYLFMQSWDDISNKRGLRFLVDNVHLNSRSAGILKARIKETLLAKQ